MNGGTTVATINLSGPYFTSDFALSSDNNGGTDVKLGTNPAQATIEETSGAGTLSANGSNYKLDFGIVTLGANALTADLEVLNSAVAPADTLSGNFSIAANAAFSNGGFSAFSGKAAAQADTAPTITFNTGNAGTFTETITLMPASSNGNGTASLPNETLTVTGTVAAPPSISAPSAVGVAYSAWVSLNATDTAPVVTRSNANVNVGHGTVAATSLFTAADGDTDGIVQYDFYDSAQAGGHWLLNGVAQPNNQILSFSASQVSQITYRGGAGTETIWERASDGIQYGAWVSINATGADIAPVVAPTSASIVVSHNSSVAASSLFTVYDQDGDPITQYDFWDTGAGGGHWSINGQPQGSNQEIVVNASQLSQVTYTPGAGIDTLYMRVSDASGFGPWTVPGFTATDAAPVSTWYSNALVAVTAQTFAASNLLTATDTDGDPITQYDFWDTGAGGGHWSVNGVAKGSNQEIVVNASQLAQVSESPHSRRMRSSSSRRQN
jgi:hypothetical protein